MIVSFRRPPVMILAHGETNYVRFRLGPEMEIGIGARVKVPGEKLISEPTELRVTHNHACDEMSPY